MAKPSVKAKARRTLAKPKSRPSGDAVTSFREGTSGLELTVLLEGEDIARYKQLLDRVTEAVKPSDIIDELWVRDIVDLAWEAHRLRRLKAHLLNACTYRGLADSLEPFRDEYELDSLINSWRAGDRNARDEVRALLKRAGQTMEAVMARTLESQLSDFERIDRLIAHAEARRHAVLREIDRHREAVASRVRRATEQIEDADFSEVRPGTSLRGAHDQ